MRQGTVSILVGCHSPIHTALVTLAWKKVHGRWPKPWELACIALHDIGHLGLDYLDDPKQKAEHWRLGAEIAGLLFGYKGLALVAGHCAGSGHPKSDLYLPDKMSWTAAPAWWLYWQQFVEPKLTPVGKSKWKHVRDFKAWTVANVASRKPRDTHEGYLELKEKGRYDFERA
jgi:hypothetical protein